jgi:hypothetical protein
VRVCVCACVRAVVWRRKSLTNNGVLSSVRTPDTLDQSFVGCTERDVEQKASAGVVVRVSEGDVRFVLYDVCARQVK